jgi:hypothetical protein
MMISPAVAHGQSMELYGAAGPTITDAGNSLAIGAGFSPTSRLTVGFNFERTHLSSWTRRDGDVTSFFRGGTLFLGTAELRVVPFRRDRFGPYGLTGIAIGLSRPNVNALFPNRVTNEVRAIFAGAGLQAPLGERITVFADVRMMVGGEGNEAMVAVAPVRAGLVWRF